MFLHGGKSDGLSTVNNFVVVFISVSTGCVSRFVAGHKTEIVGLPESKKKETRNEK